MQTAESPKSDSSNLIPFPSHIRKWLDNGLLYTLRLDIDPTKPQEQSDCELRQVIGFLTHRNGTKDYSKLKYDPPRLVAIYREIATESLKPHYQGYFWTDKKITKYYQEKKISPYFKAFFPYWTGAKRSISLVEKEGEYLSYCAKQGQLIYKQFPPDIDSLEFLSYVKPWEPIKKYMKSSATKSLKNDILNIKPWIIEDRKMCVKAIVEIHVTHNREFTYYQIISKYNLLKASIDIEEVVDDICLTLDGITKLKSSQY